MSFKPEGCRSPNRRYSVISYLASNLSSGTLNTHFQRAYVVYFVIRVVGKRGRYQRNLISLPMHIDNCVTGYTTVMLLDGFVRRFIDSALGIKFIAQRLQSMPMVRLSTGVQLAASHLELLDKFRRRFLKGSWGSRVFA